MNENKMITFEVCKTMATQPNGCEECPYFRDDKNCYLSNEIEYLIDSAIRRIKEGVDENL